MSNMNAHIRFFFQDVWCAELWRGTRSTPDDWEYAYNVEVAHLHRPFFGYLGFESITSLDDLWLFAYGSFGVGNGELVINRHSQAFFVKAVLDDDGSVPGAFTLHTGGKTYILRHEIPEDFDISISVLYPWHKGLERDLPALLPRARFRELTERLEAVTPEEIEVESPQDWYSHVASNVSDEGLEEVDVGNPLGKILVKPVQLPEPIWPWHFFNQRCGNFIYTPIGNPPEFDYFGYFIGRGEQNSFCFAKKRGV